MTRSFRQSCTSCPGAAGSNSAIGCHVGRSFLSIMDGIWSRQGSPPGSCRGTVPPMCNLYTLRLSAWEVRNLMQHYKLIGQDWADVFGARNDALELYPNYEAPVVVVRDGQRV